MINQAIINTFSGGVLEDKRAGWVYHKAAGFWTTNNYSISKHFDTSTYQRKLVPFNQTQACNNEQKGYNIRRFCYYGTKLYGLGDAQSGNATRVQIFETLVGGTDSWSASTNGTGTTTNKSTDWLFNYKTYLFNLAGGSYLQRFDTAGGAFSDTYQSLSYTTTRVQAIPIRHPNDDIAYFFGDNIVHKLDNTSWTGSVLTLPATERIVAACPYGNYLAIATVTTDTYNVRSTVYLWDRDSSLTTLSDRIDFGEGKLIHLATLDNKLTAVVLFYLDDALGLGKGKIQVKQANGNTSVILNELTSDSSATLTPPIARVIRDNKMYFPLEADYNGDTRLGIWVVDSMGHMTIALVEAEVASQNTGYQDIYPTGNVWWIAHSGDGSVNRSSYSVSATDRYSTTNASIYETLIFDGGDSAQQKKLTGIAVSYEPLPVAGSTVKVEYRKNEETAWTTIFSHASDANSISHSAVNIESTGATLPTFKEIQFRVSSLSGAVITGLKFKYEPIDNDIL